MRHSRTRAPRLLQAPLRAAILMGCSSCTFWAAKQSSPQSLPQAPRYVSRIWRSQDGLPENRIRALAQTPDGYLWIATSSGLARFDGVRFVVNIRLNTPSMTDDNIRDLAVARDGSLWVATEGGGVLHQKDGRFESFG